jgi:hypothetical protein
MNFFFFFIFLSTEINIKSIPKKFEMETVSFRNSLFLISDLIENDLKL